MSRLVLEHVDVIDVVHGRVLSARTVSIEDGRIAAIRDVSEAPVPEGALRVDGRGAFLMPGLIDAHVHFDDIERQGPLCLVNGVCFVREMGSHTEASLRLRGELARGDRVGPEMTVAGSLLDGPSPRWPHAIACADADAAREAAATLAEAGVDHLKVYGGLGRDAYAAIADEARERGLPLVGHVPFAIDLVDVVKAGQASVEHLDGLESLVARAAGREPPDRRTRNTLEPLWLLFERADPERLRRGLAPLARAGVVQCPTLVVFEGLMRAPTTWAQRDPLRDFVSAEQLGAWDKPPRRRWQEFFRSRFEAKHAMVRTLHAAGVPLVCGTDLGQVHVYAGFSLHREMALFQEAGIPASEVLRCATIHAARLCRVSDRLGSIDEGKTASLVLVEANPLEDVRNAARIKGIVFRGAYHDREELERMLERVRSM